jgi:hypothetical protein
MASYSALTRNIEADTGTPTPLRARLGVENMAKGWFPNSLNLSLQARGINRQRKQLTSSNCDNHGVLEGREAENVQQRGGRVKKAVSKRYGIDSEHAPFPRDSAR